jgi:hypothetical protein
MSAGPPGRHILPVWDVTMRDLGQVVLPSASVSPSLQWGSEIPAVMSPVWMEVVIGSEVTLEPEQGLL